MNKKKFAKISTERFIAAMNAEGIPNQASYPPLHELDMFKSGEYRKRLIGKQAKQKHGFLKKKFPATQKAAWETVWIPQPVLLGNEEDMREIAAGQLEKRYSDLKFWMDELCYAYEAGYPKNKKLPVYEFDDGDVWGNVIFSDLEAGTSAWIYWNAILDETGGPWAISPIHGNPDPNVQHPVVIINKSTHEITYTGTYYYLAHFSKFVRPGATRVQTAGKAGGVRVMAFQAADGGYVTQILNSLNQDSTVDLVFKGRSLHLALQARSITTVTW